MPDTKKPADPWAAWQQAADAGSDSFSDVSGASRGDPKWAVNAEGQHLEVQEP